MTPQKIVVIVMLVSLMLDAGLQANRNTLKAAFSDAGMWGRALLANFVLVPLFAIVVVRLLNLDEYVEIGILLMAIAPGVPVLARAAGRTAGGSLGFAVALGFIMPTLATVTAPLTARFIFPADAAASVPLGPTIVSLIVFQIVPLLLGMLIAQRAPAAAGKLDKPLTAVFGLCVLTLFVILGPTLLKSVTSVYGSYGMLTALLIVLFSLGIGWLLGGSDPRYRHTLAIGTALRNIGLALLIATLSFPGTVAGAMVLAYFLIQVIVAVIAGKLFAHGAKPHPIPAH